MAKTKAKLSEQIVGARVKCIRPMTRAEGQRECWNFHPRQAPLVIVLDSGIHLYAARDDEGNGPGALFGFNTVLKEGIRPVPEKGEGD